MHKQNSVHIKETGKTKACHLQNVWNAGTGDWEISAGSLQQCEGKEGGLWLHTQRTARADSKL